MLTVFVNKKSELTVFSEERYVERYRTRCYCECDAPKNSRDAVLLVYNSIVEIKVIRCKACATRKEVSDVSQL